MRYVTRWRMHVALDLLRNSGATVSAVAVEVGYESEAAFSRAFKRVMGVSPRAARKTEHVAAKVAPAVMPTRQGVAV